MIDEALSFDCYILMNFGKLCSLKSTIFTSFAVAEWFKLSPAKLVV